MGYSPWGCEESDTTKATEHTHRGAKGWTLCLALDRQVNFLPVSAFCAYGAGASCLRQAADEPPSRLQSRSKSLIEVDFSIPSYRPLHSSMSTFRRTVPKVIFSFFLFGHLSIPLLPSLSGWHSAQTVKGIQLGCRPHPCRLPWKD